MQIAILNLENTLKSALFGIEELFYINENFCKQDNEIKITTKIVTVDSISQNDSYNIVIIPPIMSKDSFNFDIPKLNQWLKTQYFKGAVLCSACLGSFFIASSGLLDKKKDNYSLGLW